VFLLIVLLLAACDDRGINIQPEAAARIGAMVFQNECAGREICLTSWNRGEEFASMGIGHFIWYRKGETGPFEESFPLLIRFMSARSVVLPSWLHPGLGLPWQTRAAFLDEMESSKMVELRQFLANTKKFQAEFMARRLAAALPKILQTVPEEARAHIKEEFYRIAAAPMGMYALVDYVNFKGEGTRTSERYQGEGWGLLQVLQEMDANPYTKASQAFADAASYILERRVRLAPKDRHEERWLAGWKKRVRSYE